MVLHMEGLRKKACFFHAENARTQKMLIELDIIISSSNQISNRRGYIFILVLVLSNI